MGGFFGVASKKDCVLELFYGVGHRRKIVCWSFFTGWIIILISARGEAEWRYMERAGSTAPYII